MKPTNQLVAGAQKACEHFEIFLLAPKEVFLCFAVFVGTTCRENIFPFRQANLLEALSLEQKEYRLILLHAAEQWYYLRVEHLGLDTHLTVLTIDDERNLDDIGLFQDVFDHLTMHLIRTQ